MSTRLVADCTGSASNPCPSGDTSPAAGTMGNRSVFLVEGESASIHPSEAQISQALEMLANPNLLDRHLLTISDPKGAELKALFLALYKATWAYRQALRDCANALPRQESTTEILPTPEKSTTEEVQQLIQKGLLSQQIFNEILHNFDPESADVLLSAILYLEKDCLKELVEVSEENFLILQEILENAKTAHSTFPNDESSSRILFNTNCLPLFPRVQATRAKNAGPSCDSKIG